MLQTDSWYHCTTAHIKSSNHMLSLHRPTSNSSSTSTELLCAVVFTFSWLNSDLIPASGCHYIDSAQIQQKTTWIVDEACLPVGCLGIYILLLSAIVCCGDMFIGPLPSNGSIRHSIIIYERILCGVTITRRNWSNELDIQQRYLGLYPINNIPIDSHFSLLNNNNDHTNNLNKL
jgi:hypothetical protein